MWPRRRGPGTGQLLLDFEVGETEARPGRGWRGAASPSKPPLPSFPRCAGERSLLGQLQAGTPAHRQRSCPLSLLPAPPARLFAPAASRPLLVFLEGGSCTHRAQQFPARASAFLSPSAGPSRRFPTLGLDAAAGAAWPRVLPCPPAALPQFPQLPVGTVGMQSPVGCVSLLGNWGAPGGAPVPRGGVGGEGMAECRWDLGTRRSPAPALAWGTLWELQQCWWHRDVSRHPWCPLARGAWG